MTRETVLYTRQYYAALDQRYSTIINWVEGCIEDQVDNQEPLSVHKALANFTLGSKEFSITQAYATRLYDLKQQEVPLRRAEQWRMQPHIRPAQTHLAARWGAIGAIGTTIAFGQPLIGGAVGAALGSIHEEFTENLALRRAGGRSEEYTALERQIVNLKCHTYEAYFR